MTTAINSAISSFAQPKPAGRRRKAYGGREGRLGSAAVAAHRVQDAKIDRVQLHDPRRPAALSRKSRLDRLEG